MFQVIKSKAREFLDDNEDEMMEGESKMAFRHRKLQRVINESIQAVTAQKITNSFRHVLAKVVPKAIRMEDL